MLVKDLSLLLRNVVSYSTTEQPLIPLGTLSESGTHSLCNHITGYLTENPAIPYRETAPV